MTDEWDALRVRVGRPDHADAETTRLIEKRLAELDAEGRNLLDDVRSFIARFVAFPSSAALDAVALWVAHAHLIAAGENSPRLALLSPEPGSGKTRTLEVLELLVPAPMFRPVCVHGRDVPVARQGAADVAI